MTVGFPQYGDDSELHVVIMDEIDSIAAKRGMRQGGTGVEERIVNQLLSILDGVEDLNNILVIGMTNRIDILDSAILRPGRLEIHVEIGLYIASTSFAINHTHFYHIIILPGLPDEKGRLQILEIHTESMRKASRLAADVNIQALAQMTKNFTGAELSSLVKNASGKPLKRSVVSGYATDHVRRTAFACSREINNPLNQAQGMAKANPVVNVKDFDRALEQTVRTLTTCTLPIPG